MRFVPGWFLERPEAATRLQIFRWWEARRLYYNAYVGAVGVFSWLLVMLVGSAAVKPGEDFEEPLAMIFGPVVYGILANLFYSLGSVFDLIFYRSRPRVRLFRTGLILSIVATTLPGLWAVVAWLVTIVSGKKLN